MWKLSFIVFIPMCISANLVGSDVDRAGLDRARDAQDHIALERATAAFGTAAKAAPKDAEAQYRAALAASYQAEVALELKDKAQAKTAAETGIAWAEHAIELQPKNGEYYRLLATLCGQVIPASPLAGISYGKRAKEAISKAVELSPKSAEVQIASGVGNYYLPPMFGGGPELAAKDFSQAIALDPKSAEAYMWMGITLRKMHKNAEARQAFAKSVELNPHRIWAKEQLDKTPAQ